MSALTDTIAALNGDAGVLAIIGADNVKPYPLDAQAVLPAITYHVVGTPTTQAIDGSVFESRQRICLQLHGKSEGQVEALNVAVLAVVPSIGGCVEVADAGRDVPETLMGIKRRAVDLRVLR